MRKSVAFIHWNNVAHTITGVQHIPARIERKKALDVFNSYVFLSSHSHFQDDNNLTSCWTTGIQGKNNLNSDIHRRTVESLKHDLCHLSLCWLWD
jgi:hypothetical protein